MNLNTLETFFKAKQKLLTRLFLKQREKMAQLNNERGFIGSEQLEAAISPATICSRKSAEKSFNKFMLLFPDLMRPTLDEMQSRICELFGKKNFEFIFGESKKLFFDEKLVILQNFI